METPLANSAPADSRSGAVTYGLLGAVLVVSAIFAVSSSFYADWYAIFKAVHVMFAVVWVGGGTLLTLFAILAERSNDPAQIAGVARQAAFVGEKVFAPAGLVVFLMGIAMMVNTDWGWGKFWIVAGLVGYASTFITGIAVLSPLGKKIHHSVQEKGPLHPETMAMIKRIMLIARFDVAILLLVVADMVTKPFS